MTRKTFFSFFALLLVCAGGLWARPVDLETARLVAQNFWKQKVPNDKDVSLVDVSSRFSLNGLYLFEKEEGDGFVLVSGDDVALPVLGYSLTNGVGNELSDGTAYWFRFYEEEIEDARARGVEQDGETVKMWERLKAGAVLERVLPTSVSPMLTTTWNQSPYYNEYCPVDGYSHVPSGCTATATAQVMKFWNYPATGTGSHSYASDYGVLSADFGNTTYRWSDMPTRLSSSSSTDEVDAVATLMYHVGVAVEMGYGPDGSGAFVCSDSDLDRPSSENALVDYFGYKSSLHGVQRDDCSLDLWKALLRSDLDAGRPAIYVGFDVSAGHSFVCDGYDEGDLFHINWGWGGYCDGYYAIDALNPTPGGTGGNPTGTYNIGQQLLLGIEPNLTPQPTVTVTADPQSPEMGAVTGGGTYATGSELTLTAAANDGFRFERWSDGCRYNPRPMRVNTDIELTAIYCPVRTGDTLQYDNGRLWSSLGMGSSDYTVYWGVRFAAGDIAGYDYLTQVLAYTVYSANYTVNIYQGGEDAPDSLVYTQSQYISGVNRWHEIALSTAVPLDTSQPLWIVMENAGELYPAAMSLYSGSNNSGWFSTDGSSWTPITEWGFYNSFMIRGVLAHRLGLAFDAEDSDFVKEYSWDQASTANREGNIVLTTVSGSDGAVSRIVFHVAGGDTSIPAGVYSINASGAEGTVAASSGVVENSVTPSFAGFVDNNSMLHPPLWFMCSGMVEVTTVGSSFRVEVNAENSYGRAISITVLPQPTYYRITATVNDAAMGRVEGGGDYEAGSEATLTAIANEGFYFVRWSNGETANPYEFEVVQDDTIEAEFASNVSICDVSRQAFSLYPNPTTGIVSFDVPDVRRVEVVDRAGRSVTADSDGSSVDLGDLRPGVYFLRLVTAERVLVAKVVKE